MECVTVVPCGILSWFCLLIITGVLAGEIKGVQDVLADETHVDLLPAGSSKLQAIESSTPSTCLQNEYGPSCAYCRPRDSCVDGHYTCDDQTGAQLCLPGWHGADCREPDVPEVKEYHVTCPESQCRNGGSCVGTKCCCVEGFTGILCEVEIIECTNDTCKNGGICRDLVGNFSCLCKTNFKGDRCEIDVGSVSRTTHPSRDSGCHENKCLNNGRCFEDAVYTYCLCPTGYTVDHCETNLLVNSTPLPCQENYYGFHCDVLCLPKDDCHGGHFVCHQGSSTGSKICLSGWIGKNCATRMLPQHLDPICPANLGCKNDGQCFQGGCCCKHNYTGDFCNIESLGCLSNPCRNNATCINSGNGFLCICDTYFTGRQCEILISPSTPGNESTTMALMPTIVTASSTVAIKSRQVTSSINAPTLLSTTFIETPALTFSYKPGLNTELHSSHETLYTTNKPSEHLSTFTTTKSLETHSLSNSDRSIATNFLSTSIVQTPAYDSSSFMTSSPSIAPSAFSSSSFPPTTSFKPTVTFSSTSLPLYSSSMSAIISSQVTDSKHDNSILKSTTHPLPISAPAEVNNTIKTLSKLYMTPYMTSTALTVSAATLALSTSTISPTSVSVSSSVTSGSSVPSVSILINKPDDDGAGDSKPVKSDPSLSWWVILVIVVGIVTLIGIVMVVIVTWIHQRRHDSRTLENKPELVRAFDKEHFSAQPEFVNHSYDLNDDSDDDSIKHDIYVVNE